MCGFRSPATSSTRRWPRFRAPSADIVDYESDWSLGEEFTKPCDDLRLAYLANPNSPSGTTLPPAEVAEARRRPALPAGGRRGVRRLRRDELPRVSLRENEKVLVVADVEQVVRAGRAAVWLSRGPAAGHRRELVKVKDSYNCDALSIAGATAAIDDQAWFVETRAAILATRARLTSRVAGARLRSASTRRPTSSGAGTRGTPRRSCTSSSRPAASWSAT